MAQQTSKVSPNYHRIYFDLIERKFPHRINEFRSALENHQMTTAEVILLNRNLFGNSREEENQKLKSYDKSDIIEILEYQKKHNLNNSQLSEKLKVSRNTIAKWKKLFLIQ